MTPIFAESRKDMATHITSGYSSIDIRDNYFSVIVPIEQFPSYISPVHCENDLIDAIHQVQITELHSVSHQTLAVHMVRLHTHMS
jgi:hypothetical protein